ncbi:beta-amyrin 11-oxidase [Trifolium repens]|nr:beta-amyrin 11-oxidase [Trifolium repens]
MKFLQWFWMSVATLLALYIFAIKVVRNLNDWYYDFKMRNKEYPLPPGDMGWPFIGNLWPFYKYFSSNNPDTFINNIVHKYGRTGIYKTHLYGSPSIIVTGHLIANKVLKDDVNFKVGYPKATLKLVETKHLLNEHRHFKRLITAPMAGYNSLERYLELIEDIVINKLEELSSMKHPVEFLKETRKVTFKVLFHIFMGSCDQHIVDKFEDLFDVMSIGVFSLIPINAPFFPFNKAVKARKKLVKIIQSIIDERKMMIQNGQKKDILDILLEDKGENSEDDDIIDLLIVLLFTGHETTAIAVMWSITYLTNNPLCLKKAREEQEEIMKARASSQKRLSIKEIKKMVYLSQVIDETLRHANMFSAFREATTDLNINGFLIPKGWKVLVWLRAIHMDHEYHLNPKEFNPARWNDYNPAIGTFLPFGIGPWLCPGSDLARYEITIFLHYFLLNYKLEQINLECPLTNLPSPKPVDNCLAKVIKLSTS